LSNLWWKYQKKWLFKTPAKTVPLFRMWSFLYLQPKKKVNFKSFLSFRSFICGHQNKEGLKMVTRLSRTTLWRRFTPFFNYLVSPLEVNSLLPLKENQGKWVLGLDGKWLHRSGAVMIYRDITHGVNLYWSFQKSESLENLSEDFYQLSLLIKTNPPYGIVSDWKKAITTLIAISFPKLSHQRCLAHVQRELKRFLPSGSPLVFTLALRKISEELMEINDPTNYYLWDQKLQSWFNDYGYLLKEKTIGKNTKKKWWYTHGNLRRAVRLLTEEEGFFAYLHYPFLPKTNNSLEGVNSQLKGKLNSHRGMKTKQQMVFCFWSLVFSRIKTEEDLKKLWVSLKKRIFTV